MEQFVFLEDVTSSTAKGKKKAPFGAFVDYRFLEGRPGPGLCPSNRLSLLKNSLAALI